MEFATDLAPLEMITRGRDPLEACMELIRQRMLQLSPAEFQNLLRPAFQEEEAKLIIMGAVLGFIAGMAQLYFIFGGI